MDDTHFLLKDLIFKIEVPIAVFLDREEQMYATINVRKNISQPMYGPNSRIEIGAEQCMPFVCRLRQRESDASIVKRYGREKGVPW